MSITRKQTHDVRRHLSVYVSITKTTGVFVVPRLISGITPELRLYVSNERKEAGAAEFVVYVSEGGKETVYLRKSFQLTPNGTAESIDTVRQLGGKPVRVVATLSSEALQPSLAVVKTFSADGGEQTEIWLPPASFR